MRKIELYMERIAPCSVRSPNPFDLAKGITDEALQRGPEKSRGICDEGLGRGSQQGTEGSWLDELNYRPTPSATHRTGDFMSILRGHKS